MRFRFEWLQNALLTDCFVSSGRNMATKWLGLLLVSLRYCYGAEMLKCCPGDNTLENNTCSHDNSAVSVIDCSKYILDPYDEENSDLDRDVENNLIFGDETMISTESYCITKRVNSSRELYLVCFEDDEDDNSQLFLTVLGLLSVAFLTLTFVVYALLPELQDLQGVCIMHAVSGLAVGFLTLGINQTTVSASGSVCEVLTFITYFSFMYAFFWLNALSFHIWRTTIKPKSFEEFHKWKYVYHVYAILGPIVLLIFLMVGHYGSITALDHVKPNIGQGTCWFSTLKSQIVYFYSPIAVLVILNVVFYIWTLAVLCVEIGNTRQHRVLFYRLKLCVKLFFIMGVPWVFEIVSAMYKVKNLKTLWLITDALNSAQGLLIFCVLVLFRKKVLRALANKEPFNRFLPNRWRTLQDEENDEDTKEDEAIASQIATA